MVRTPAADGGRPRRSPSSIVVVELLVVEDVVALDLLDLRRRRGSPRAVDGARAGPVQVLVELLDDVLPEVVERATDADPGVLAGAADERLDAEAERADLGLGGQLGDGLELALGLGVVELLVVVLGRWCRGTRRAG